MPVYYDMPSSFGNAVVEDINRFNQLPFYLVHNEVSQFPIWNELDQLYGKIDWETNQGNVMRGVTPQRSPVGRSLFFPNPVTQVANKDIYQVTESKEEAVVYVHKYSSFQFNFMPSFTAFWETYLQFADKDIVEKIAISNNQFIETQMWFNASFVYLCGVGLVSGVPTGAGNKTLNAAGSKTAAWLVGTTLGQGGVQGVQQNLRLRDVYNAVMNLQEDNAAPPFQGVRNMPKDNDGVKGKYVLLLSSEAWMNFTYDPGVAELKSIELDLLFSDFRGSLFGTLTCKIKKYPIRYNVVDIKDLAGTTMWAAGFPIDPEIFDPIENKWKPNPYYTSLVSAPYEIEWLLGDSYAKTIKVGPPPKEFATVSMSAQKFYSMKWNGEVRLTDQVLISNPDGTIELNVYGENLMFISKLTHGYLVGERRYAFPIIQARTRPAKSNV
jgi:hypothetical protein